VKHEKDSAALSRDAVAWPTITRSQQQPNGNEEMSSIPPKLSESEQDLLTHIERGYELETDSLGGNPILRRLKDNEVLRPDAANGSTVRALEQSGLIRPGKGTGKSFSPPP